MTTLAAARRVLAAYRPRVADAPDARPAAVALLLVEAAQRLEALFIRRAQRIGDPWSGQIALPGGRHDPADPDLLATAIRETREETGVDLGRAEHLGVLDDLHPRTPTLPPVLVRPFVFALPRRPALVPGAEVERAFWVSLDRLSQAGVRREITLTLRGAERTLPAYLIDDDLIWGMTERIVTAFLNLVDRGPTAL